MKRLLCGVGLMSAVLIYGQSPAKQQRSPVAPASPTAQRAVIDQYCIACHNDKAKIGGLSLASYDLAHVGENAEVWEKVVRKLRAGMMPPPGSKRPDQATHDALTVWLENELDRAAAVKPNLVPPGVHRVNRREYANAIRDLLALDFDAAGLLPVDDSSYGFDNVAGALGVSPALLEGYMSSAAKISRLALGHELSPAEKNFVAPQDLSQETHVEGLPFGTRGGMFIKYYFPADGEYVFNWAPIRGNTGEFFGGNRKGEQLEISIDGSRVKVFNLDDAEFQQGTDFDKHEVKWSVKAGLRTVGFAFLDTSNIPIDDLNQHNLRSVLDTNPIPGYIFSPQVGRVTIMGPYDATVPKDTPSRKKIFVCEPKNATEEPACAKQIITSLAKRAFRRPVNEEDMESLMSFYENARSKGGFENGIEIALQRILADPEFVFRSEAEPNNIKPGQTYRISDLELASRLSFFLWSTNPDDRLIDLASQNKLHDPAVLDKEVKRMLADPRSHELVVNFAGQWLQLRNLASSAPLAQNFPDFDDNLRQGFRTETEMFFESILREDRSVLDLLTADYTFVNERVARHYGIPNIYGPQFRRVGLGADLDVRRGLLGKGAVLLVTALSDRTSPVQRGKWVLMNMLGIIPPDPPPNVPLLRESDKKANGQPVALEIPMRDRMEEHRANPSCASCHMKIDPLGFALEGFDAVGKFRTTQFGKTLDLSGQLSDGTKINGVAGLRQGLVKYSPQFVRTVTEKLLTYALGRGVEYYDMPVVRSIVKEAAPGNYRLSSLISSIVRSQPFQMNVKVQETASK
jgi:mono/diheme cytochrome c family protein